MLRVLAAAALLGAAGCASIRPAVPPPAPAPAPPPSPAPLARELTVTASAYNSVADQTDGKPHETASGETLRPGVRAIAVSDDLFEAGLDFGTRVEIEGLPGEWVVMDRMHSRWSKKIDVYMGTDEQAALQFGERRVKIRWRPPGPSRAPLPSTSSTGS
jgi:3D (Asp-Asp-Asp) domain-containing protein